MQHVVGLSRDRRRKLRFDEEVLAAVPFGLLRRRAIDLHYEHLADPTEYSLCLVVYVRAADILPGHDPI